MDVLNAWDVGKICDVEKIYRDTVFKVVTQETVWILKDLGTPDRGQNQNLTLQYDILHHLNAADIPVAIPLKNRDGQIVTLYNEHLYILIPYLSNGSRPTTTKDRLMRYRNCGIAIAKLHLALRTFPIERFGEKLWETEPATAMFRNISDIRAHIDGERSTAFEAFVPEMTEIMKAALEGLEMQLIHRDCHPGNVLVDGTTVTGFVDCDHLSLGSRIVDLAYFTIHFVMRQTADKDRCLAWLEEFPVLLEGYEEVSELSDRERTAFPYMMVFVILLFAAFQFKNKNEADAYHQLDTLEWVHAHWDTICTQALRQK